MDICMLIIPSLTEGGSYCTGHSKIDVLAFHNIWYRCPLILADHKDFSVNALNVIECHIQGKLPVALDHYLWFQ